MCLPHFHFFSDLLLHRPAATWNLFVLFDKEAKFVDGDSIYASTSDKSCVRTDQNTYIIKLIIQLNIIRRRLRDTYQNLQAAVSR